MTRAQARRGAHTIGRGRIGLLPVVAAAIVSLLPAVASAQAAPSAHTYATRYDAGRRVVGTIAPDPDGAGPLRHAAVRNTYDPTGRLTRVEKGELADWQSEGVPPASWPGFTILTVVDTQYDAMSRKTIERVSGNGVPTSLTQLSYDAGGQLECTAVRMNPAAFGSLPASACTVGAEGSFGPDRITRQVYDAAGQLLTVQKAYGTPLQQDYATYAYTLNGKRKAVVDANGNRAEMGYDGHDRQVSWVFPSKTAVGQVDAGDYEAYGYDENGNRTILRKRDGRTITYTYDALNRATSKTFPQGGARGVYYGYDLRGLQTAARFDGPGGTDAVTSTWNGFGQQLSSTTVMAGVSRTIGYGSDPDGNRTYLAYPDGQYINYYRDGVGRLYYADRSPAFPLFHPVFNQLGSVQSLYRWAAGWNVPTGHHYDYTGRLVGIDHHLPGTGNVTSAFTYNPASQMVSRTRSNDAYAFTGHVAVTRAYTTNGLNQYTAAGLVGFTYDPNGNLTGDGSNGYGYDIENRLISASNGLQMTWDPMGRLFQTSGTSSGTRQFLYDGDAMVAEYDGAGAMAARYVHSDGDDDPMVWYEGAGTTSPRYLYADHQGSVVAVADAAGTPIALNSYDEYGISKNSLNGAVEPYGRFGYTGQAWIPELGMYHYKARIYSPNLGRFLQTDPIGYDDQVNLYAYVANDPVNLRDPSGQCAVVCRKEIAAAGARAGQRYLGSAVVSQLDSPLAGPADAVAAGIALVTTVKLGWDVATALYNDRPSKSAEDRRRGSAPTDAPRGTRPIDKSGIDREGVHGIKDGIGAAPDDWVGVGSDGGIITTDPQTGKAVPQGNISDHGVERGQRDREDRDRRRGNDE